MKVAELDHEAVLDHADRKVVEEPDRGDVTVRFHRQADRLDAFLEQAIDLRGQGGPGVVAALGEVGVAAAAARDRGEQVLVVAEADADGRADGSRPLGAGRELLEPPVVGDPGVRVAVGEQDQRRAPVGPCDPLDLLESAR